MVLVENRSAAALLAVSTGSADRCRSQPGMDQSKATQKKTLVPGAMGRGFLLRSSRYAKPAVQEAWATGGKPASNRLDHPYLGAPGFLPSERIRQVGRKLSQELHILR